MEHTINIQSTKSLWQLFLNAFMGESRIIKYGDFIHYLPKGATTKNIQKGSILVGRFKKDDGQQVFGSYIVLHVEGENAKIKLLTTTNPEL